MSPIMRLAPIYWLTVREFAAGKAVRVTALFAATPVVFALIYLLQSDRPNGVRFLGDLFLNFVAPVVVPLATLILSTAALGNELSDRTMPYLALKPIDRWRITVEKYTGVVVVTAAPVLVGIAVTWAIVARQQGGVGARTLAALLVSALCGILAYAALFLFVSLVIPRALIVGIIYVLLWEGLLAGIITGAAAVSVRHYTLSIFVRLLHQPAVKIDRPMQLDSALLVLGLLVLASLILTTLRLRRMSLD